MQAPQAKSEELKRETIPSPADTGINLPEPDLSENYEDWRRQFAAERLKVLYYLGLIANPVFIAADVLLHRQYLSSLFGIRVKGLRPLKD